MANKNVLKHIIFITIVLTIITSVLANEVPIKLPEWYQVSAWEIEVCSKWGGSELAQVGATSAAPISLSQLTVTLQAEAIYYEPIGNTSIDNIYTVSWYIQPIGGEFEYAVYLVDANGATANVASGTASYESPGFSHKALSHPTKFIKARIDWPGNSLLLPIIPK
ncbi:MAG: hypothetical protein KJ601_02430 [Nanoarchaeota archaeon]|nr:hypothetical protein [Nanoarchaeota archaeon]MBU1704841.1 hypothetical protein [Nanoarchaeota archaeon]